MKMTLRWFGPGQDSVTLEEIRVARYPRPRSNNSFASNSCRRSLELLAGYERKTLEEAAGLKLLELKASMFMRY
jgi:hypothetical protein